MAKKKKRQQDEEKSAASYYQLKTDAVDRLVNAKDAPAVSEAEIKKYTSKGKFHIPTWLKIVFIKFWFAGAICYFFLWGLGLYIQGLDLMFALAVGLGIVNDLMVNKVLRSLEPEPRDYDKWIMVTTREFWSIFINVIYAGVVLYCVFQTYYVINIMFGVDANVTEAETMLGVEPIMFGLFYMGFDMLLITVKNTFIKIFHDAGVNFKTGK